jgi:hypothetical protein
MKHRSIKWDFGNITGKPYLAISVCGRIFRMETKHYKALLRDQDLFLKFWKDIASTDEEEDMVFDYIECYKTKCMHEFMDTWKAHRVWHY